MKYYESLQEFDLAENGGNEFMSVQLFYYEHKKQIVLNFTKFIKEGSSVSTILFDPANVSFGLVKLKRKNTKLFESIKNKVTNLNVQDLKEIYYNKDINLLTKLLKL